MTALQNYVKQKENDGPADEGADERLSYWRTEADTASSNADAIQ